MQGFVQMNRQVAGGGALAGHLVPAGSVFAFVAARRAEVFRDADRADLFAPAGAGPALGPGQADGRGAPLQVLCDYSAGRPPGRSASACGGRAAIGAAADDAGLGPSLVVYWRDRIARSQRPHRINAAVEKVVQGDRTRSRSRRRRPGSLARPRCRD